MGFHASEWLRALLAPHKILYDEKVRRLRETCEKAFSSEIDKLPPGKLSRQKWENFQASRASLEESSRSKNTTFYIVWLRCLCVRANKLFINCLSMLNDYGNEVNNSSILARFYSEQRSFAERSTNAFRQKPCRSAAYGRQDKTQENKKNKTDCVGFMLQNRDN